MKAGACSAGAKKLSGAQVDTHTGLWTLVLFLSTQVDQKEGLLWKISKKEKSPGVYVLV